MARCQWMPSERMELNKVIWASSHLLRFHLCSRDYFFWNSPKANMVGCWWMLFFGRNCLLNSMSIEPSSGLRLYTFSVYFASFVVKWLHSIGLNELWIWRGWKGEQWSRANRFLSSLNGNFPTKLLTVPLNILLELTRSSHFGQFSVRNLFQVGKDWKRDKKVNNKISF